jgi:thiamine-phosphate diphosphorylase
VVTGLGPLLVLTDRTQASRPLAEVVRAAVEAGARTVILREKDLPEPERQRLAEEIQRIVEAAGGTVIGVGAERVHLAAAEPLPDPRPLLVGRSCHDEDEVDRAGAERVDYVTCSPVFPSRSKPGYGPVLGLSGLGELCRRTPVPVYALGGVTAPTARWCRDAGAAGVAVMGGIMRAPDPAVAVVAILAALT